MDGDQARPAADQRVGVDHVLPDVHGQTARQVPHQGLPHALMRTLRLRRHPRTIAEETRRQAGREHERWSVHDFHGRMSGGLRHRPGDDGQRRVVREPHARQGRGDRQPDQDHGQTRAATIAAGIARASAGEARPDGQHEQARLQGRDRGLRSRGRLQGVAESARHEARGNRRRGQKQRGSRTRRRGFSLRHEMELSRQGHRQADLSGL